MTNFARTLSTLAPRHRSRFAGTLLALAATLAALLLGASPAAAVVEEVEGVKVGLQPRQVTSAVQGDIEKVAPDPKKHEAEKLERRPEVYSFENAAGNPVVHGSSDYVIYWDPGQAEGSLGNYYYEEWQSKVNHFMRSVEQQNGSDGYFSPLGQYRDSTNAGAAGETSFKGAYVDDAAYPPSGCTDPRPMHEGELGCLTDKQIREQLTSFIGAHGLPTGMSTVYFLLTPPGLTLCLTASSADCSDYTRSLEEMEESEYNSTSYKNSFCSYHGDIDADGAPNGDASTILYGAIPWTAGTWGDGWLSQGYSGWECQDGGWVPTTEQPLEAKETTGELSAEQKQEIEEEDPEEQEVTLNARSGAHAQEPTQAPGVGTHGFYETGLPDLIISQLAIQQQNIATDPLLDGWQDERHEEVSDQCRNWYENPNLGGKEEPEPTTLAGLLSNSTFAEAEYVQDVFSMSELHRRLDPCTNGIDLEAAFTAPETVKSGELVGFDGMESNVSLWETHSYANGKPTEYATYSWNFGDGTPVVTGYAPGAPECAAPWLSPCAGSVFHSFTYGGEYTVTLTITDVGGHTTTFSEPVKVDGPPPPVVASTTTGSATSSTSSSSTTGTKPAKEVRSFPAPVAAAVVISRSLKTLPARGVQVRYSVNEQVAGRFEVLLSQAVARRLHIGGAPATGLPAGTPAQVVIAKYVLVTTKGGRSVLSIRLSKKVAKNLARLRQAKLMLRLVVRNASTATPTSTTVVSSATLYR